MKVTVEREIAGRRLVLETGVLARQANGSVLVTYGETIILATAVMDSSERVGLDFFPLTVDYREKQYAAGKIPGGFFKRESRPSEKETITCRLIDRPIRPLFPEGFKRETQVMLAVLSADDCNDPDIPSMVGAFAALAISDIPFEASLGAVRVGLIDSDFVINPTHQELEKTRLNLTMAGTRDAIMMVESGADNIDEETMIRALEEGHRIIGEIAGMVDDLRADGQKEKLKVDPVEIDSETVKNLRSKVDRGLKNAILVKGKTERSKALEDLFLEGVSDLLPTEEDPEYADQRKEFSGIFHDLEAEEMRRLILDESLRVDGRGMKEIRPISIQIGTIPRAHGSALFTRGETQSLGTTTLGTTSDELIIDNLLPEHRRHFYLHYNFPPFSTGEVKPIRGPGRREIGHGALAERAILPILPSREQFPYTIRIVSDILESNGSSSMASVCSGCLSLMDAGVPIKEPVAGIAMGLVKEGEKYAILSDILGLEDHLGDMDFKVTGTRGGITALQMDIKIGGITHDLMAEALNQAREGRLFILDKMAEAISEPRPGLKPHAPRIELIHIDIEKIRDIIGPGGKTIRGIIQETGAKIDVDDTGEVIIASPDEAALRKAREMIEALTKEVEIGEIYHGKVVRLMNFGAFVEILPSKEGLVHISELAAHRVEQVEDEVRVGDTIDVKVIEIDDLGRINLSKRRAEAELRGEEIPEDLEPAMSGGGRREGGFRDGGGGRGRDRDRSGGRGGRGRGGGRGDRGRGRR